MTILPFLFLILLMVPVFYLIVLAFASVSSAPLLPTLGRIPTTQFMIVVPAHDEANVIETTVKRLLDLDYPTNLFSIHIIADHCSDQTAMRAQEAGATVHERNEGPRTGKGAALSWFFQRELNHNRCDAVVVFDADTLVDLYFLRIMDKCLARGDQVIQGQHIISNPHQGWFPLLTWAMFIVDNRFQNLGRTNLGWSAKNMGDSICFRADILRQLGWGTGLTEDYQLRHRLLLEGIKIRYEPSAKGYGEAPQTWNQARAQRARWLRGTRDASRQYSWQLLIQGIKRQDWAMLDGALQACFPSYSTLTILTLILFISCFSLWFLTGGSRQSIIPWAIFWWLAAILIVLFFYPLFGLRLERAPRKAYLVFLMGPFFIVWRTWLALTARLQKKPLSWIRTTHGI